jgi:hypothetical protein
MDPEYVGSDEEDAEAQAMAAAMGFSSFGSHKPAAKKRKFNPTTDAFVEGEELAKIDKGGKKGQGSGGNTVPLGKERVFGVSSSEAADDIASGGVSIGGNQDEIALDDEDEEGEGPRYMDTSKAAPIENTGGYIQRHAPGNAPPPQSGVSDQEAQEVQARIDALLSSLGAPSGAEHAAQGLPHDLPARPTFSDTSFTLGGPRPPPSNYASSVTSSSRPSERGQRNPTWYVGYYDPSFNENPWAKLEKDRGLEPVGTWIDNHGVRAGR